MKNLYHVIFFILFSFSIDAFGADWSDFDNVQGNISKEEVIKKIEKYLKKDFEVDGVLTSHRVQQVAHAYFDAIMMIYVQRK